MKGLWIVTGVITLFGCFIAEAFDCGYIGYRGCGIAQIEQIGSFNSAYIEQATISRASILQEGINNIATIKQNLSSIGSNAEIFQQGSKNTAYQMQSAMQNFAYAQQTGFFNSTTQIQVGSNNSVSAIQYGAGNKATQIQLTSYNTASVIQIGFFNVSFQIQGVQGTNGNSSNLMQVGVGKVKVVFQ